MKWEETVITVLLVFCDFQLFLDGFTDFLVRGRVQERKNSSFQSPRKKLSLSLLFGKG